MRFFRRGETLNERLLREAVSVSALKSADLPTFGRPTMPQVNPMKCLVLICDL